MASTGGMVLTSPVIVATATLSGLFHRGLHVDSKTVVDKPLYGWFIVEGELTRHGLKIAKIQDFPPGANTLRRARLVGTPSKVRLVDDGYSLSLELLFGDFYAYVWSPPLIAGLLEAYENGSKVLWVEGSIYDLSIQVLRGGVYAG